MAGNVAFTLGLGDLTEPPVVRSPMVDPLKGSTESRPFQVLALDRGGGLTDKLSGAGRWRAIGRLCDVQHSTDGGAWTTYATGRISQVDQADGPGRYRIEVSDESFVARTGEVFTVDPQDPSTYNTTQIWPHGVREDWKGFDAAPAAHAVRLQTSIAADPKVVLIGISGDEVLRLGRPVDALVRWAEADAVTDPIAAGDAGSFRTLRANYAGTEYRIKAFGHLNSRDVLEGLRKPEDFQIAPYDLIHFEGLVLWIVTDVQPPQEGDFFLTAPLAGPSEEVPLHIGLADPSHKYGSEKGWIHPATLTRKVWDELGVRYNDAELTALEGNSSLGLIALRVTGVPDDPERWMEDNVWAPNMLVALPDSEGRRKLVDMRIPANVDPQNLVKLDARNARPGSWRLLGRELVNRIRFEYERLLPKNETTQNRDGALDGFVSETADLSPDYARGDTIDELGTHSLTVRHHGSLPPSFPDGFAGKILKMFWEGIGSLFPDATEIIARSLLDIYQDGPVRGQIEVSRSVAENIEPGDIVVVDTDSLKIPEPQDGS